MKRILFEIILVIGLGVAGYFAWAQHTASSSTGGQLKELTEQKSELERKLDTAEKQLQQQAESIQQMGPKAQQLDAARGWVAFGGRRFANSQADFALGVRHPRQAVDQHQHVFTLVAEVFGDHMRHVRGLEPQHWRFIGRCSDQHRFGQPFGPQGFLNEGLHLAATFADQANDHHIGLGEAGHHAQQHAFAHT